MGAGIPHHRAAAGEYNFSDIKNVTLHGNATQAIFHLNTTVSPDFELMKSPTVIQELDGPFIFCCKPIDQNFIISIDGDIPEGPYVVAELGRVNIVGNKECADATGAMICVTVGRDDFGGSQGSNYTGTWDFVVGDKSS